MIEIILLFFLCKRIGKLAQSRGLKATVWVIITILTWIGMEILGIGVALMFFEKENILSVALVGLLFGFMGYHMIHNYLQKLPDQDNVL